LPTYITFNPSGSKAFVANQGSQNIGIIDVATGVQEATIPVTGDPVPVIVSPDGTTLYTTTNVPKLWKIDIATRTVLGSMDLPVTSHQLAFHPTDPSRLYVATRAGGTVLEVSVSTLTVLRTFAVGGQTQWMAISPTANELYVADENGDLQVWNLTTGTSAGSIVTGGSTLGVILTPDESTLYVTRLSGQILVIDRASRTILKTIVMGGRPFGLGYHAGSGNVAVANDQGGWVDIVR